MPLATRRSFFSVALSAVLGAQAPFAQIRDQVFESVWTSVRDRFYDPSLRGVDWIAAKEEFLPKVASARSKEELLPILRELLRRLNNSHILLYSIDEWNQRQTMLPICFDKVDERVFVRYVLRSTDGKVLGPLLPGDEIISVDGVEAKTMEPVTIATLNEVIGNPNFGPPKSVASLEISRNGHRSSIAMNRVTRPVGFDNVILENPAPGTVHLRFFTLNASAIAPERLGRLWIQVTQASRLIVDLRNCVGGDPAVSSYIAGSLMGPGKALFRAVPRPGSSHQAADSFSLDSAPRFSGRVALITNSNTESQPEVLAALCQEYKCARIFGTRTAGAFNGFTEAIPLPANFARFALPYTRSVSPNSREYERIGVVPDEVVPSSIRDLRAKRDRPLLAAMRWLHR